MNQKESKRQRVARLQDEEKSVWGFHGRNRRGPWTWVLEEAVKHQTHIRGHRFDSKWLRLEESGWVTIKANKDEAGRKQFYAWDGCTPKFIIPPNQFVVGTPDGFRAPTSKLPMTWKASLIHDAFYQYLHIIPARKKDIDKVFRDILRESGFVLWPIYYAVVAVLGGLFVKQEGIDGRYYKKHDPDFKPENTTYLEGSLKTPFDLRTWLVAFLLTLAVLDLARHAVAILISLLSGIP